MADKTVTHYTGISTSQVDPNSKTRHTWSNVANVIGHVDNTYCSSLYSQKRVATHYTEKTVYDKNGKASKTKVADKWKEETNKPWTLAFHDFNFNIPDNAHIKKIIFTARVKCDSNVTALAPMCYFVAKTAPNNYDDGSNKTKSGWYKGHYYAVPRSTKLSTKWQEVNYHMDLEDINIAKITPDSINRSVMGCDLIWQDLEKITGSYDKNNQIKGHVYVSWVKCKIIYDVPEYSIDVVNDAYDFKLLNPQDTKVVTNNGISTVQPKTVSTVKTFGGTETSPWYTEPNEWFVLTVKCKNPSVAKGNDARRIIIDVPWGSEIREKSKSTGTFESYGDNQYLWTVPVGSEVNYTLKLKVRTKSSSLSKFTATLYREIPNQLLQTASYYYVGNQYTLDLNGKDVGYSNLDIIPVNVQAYSESCVDITVHGVVSNNNFTLHTTPNISVEKQVGRTTYFSLESVTSEGTVDILSQDDNSVNLQVPFETEFIATIRYCFIPLATGTMNLTASTSISQDTITESITLKDSEPLELDFQGGDIIKVQNHRMYSEIESDVVMIPIVADDIDSSMIMTPCQINMNIWEELDYIGCVPLEHLHFDPKSTFKDTLLNSTYKNKRYMGKKLATDEDITLNVRLHPKQVTTIQGLIEMDKPIPINANHRCFESDALNHRGWAEIYGIKSEKTNPHWYKCDIDVKYLTHNLKTRFKIDKGKNVDDYPIPSVLSEVFSSGDNLSDTSEDKFFIVETDGTFMYQEDYDDVEVNDDERNFFSIDNGEYIHIQTQNPLSHNSQVRYTWSATVMEETRENKVSKIIKLVDKQGNSVFEYEYNTLEFITNDDVIEEIKGTVIYRVGDETQEEDITYRYSDSLELDEDEVENVVSGGLATFGSTLEFNIHNNMIDVLDEGFNGTEVYFKDIPIDDTEYYYVVEWKNNNSDGNTDSVDCTVDFQVQDTILSTTYADKFGKLIISPFPVTDKKLLFTREAEEGTLYYYQFEENKEFSYIIDPYHQYKNGTDLIGDGVSIFNLNYGFDIVYIQNGLVRLGFNRTDDKGHMYLGKYDPKSESYITTNIFHLDKYVDLNVNSISDDKIELQASDSTFTIYRGHPYIKINHNDEDIYIDTLFDLVWAEQVGGDSSVDLPSYWDLLNTKNLLPSTIGGINTINTSEITVTEEIVDDNSSVNMSWYNPPSSVENEEDVTFYIQSGSLTNYSDEIFIDGSECSFGSYVFEKESDNVPSSIDVVSDKSIIQSSETTRLNAIVRDWSNTGVSGETVYFYEVFTPSITVSASDSIIQSGDSVSLTAKVKDEDGSLVQGETVYFYVKEE